jgi:hypothetical protein
VESTSETERRLEPLLQRWRSAESKLYPMVMVDPHRYETHLRLVRELSDGLAGLSTVDELIEAYGGRAGLMARTAHRMSVTIRDDIGELVVDAAFNSRYRNLVSEIQEAEARRRIREAGDDPGWVVLAETGRDYPPLPGFRQIEMRLPDGLGIHSYVDADPDTYQPVYGLELLTLDPATGEEVGNGTRATPQEFADPSAWAAAMEQARATPTG